MFVKHSSQNCPEFIPHIPAFVNNGKERMLTFRPRPLRSWFVPVLSNGLGLKCCLNESIVAYGINALSIFRLRQMYCRYCSVSMEKKNDSYTWATEKIRLVDSSGK